FHLEILDYAAVCAQKRNADTNHDECEEEQEHEPSIVHHPHPGNGLFSNSYQQIEKRRGYHSADGAVDDGPDIHRLCNEPPRSSHHLHGLDEKPVAKHGEANGIVDEEDYYKCDDHGHYHEHNAHDAKVLIHLANELFGVLHITHVSLLFEVGADLRE